LYQRIYADERPVAAEVRDPQSGAESSRPNASLIRILAGFLAAAIYVRWEQTEYAFANQQLAVLLLGIMGLTLAFCVFARGMSGFQPPEPLAALLRLIGRNTLTIYVIQLAASELIVALMPELLP
jgi:surface polysaccharide O-acyltransferase-like enzyme